MISEKARRKLFCCLLLLISILFSACEGGKESGTLTVSEGAYPVDTLFREYYDMNGGRDVFGPAISPIFSFNNRKFQYTDKACLEYNPDLPASDRIHLAPLGLDLGLNQPEQPAPAIPDPAYLNGHYIYSGFLAFYKQHGDEFIGQPLSEVHYNAEKRRYEQYFENLGLYWSENDPPETVKLLSFGAWKCDSHCRFTPDQSALVDVNPVVPSPSDELFQQAVARIGADLTGFPLGGSYTTASGKIEKIYENLVLAYDPINPGAVFAQPISEKIGILPQPLVEASPLEGMVFWPIEGTRGYNVPQPFIDYIKSHGGIEVFGQPLGEVKMNEDQVFRQCFTNICLEYHMRTNVPQSLRIRPAALGYSYRNVHSRTEDSVITATNLNSLNIQVWEKYQYINKTESQEIGAAIFDGTQPLEQVVPLLVITFPDGSQGSFYFPPTGSNGITIFRLDPMNADKGTIVPYMVCVNMLAEKLFCVKDSFVIWYNP